MSTLHKRLVVFNPALMAQPSIELMVGQHLYLRLEIEPAPAISEPRHHRYLVYLPPEPSVACAVEACAIKALPDSTQPSLSPPGPVHAKPQQIARFGVRSTLHQPMADAKNVTPTSQTQQARSHSETWWFNADARTLFTAETTITLTTIETLMLAQLVISECRVLSRDDLIQRIEKDPQCYSGLEMCLSRLQKKFKSAAHGERLVRSVRNRGYCLTQRIHLA